MSRYIRFIILSSLSFYSISVKAQANIYQYLRSTITYPSEAIANHIEGMVVTNVYVRDHGTVVKSFVERAIGGGCDLAVKNSLAAINNWNEYFKDAHENIIVHIPVKFVQVSSLINRIEQTMIEIDTIYPSIAEADKPIFKFVESEAEYPGGENKLIRFLSKNIKFPRKAIDRSIMGKTILTFEIDTLGNVRDAKIKSGIGGGCDEEALRVVSLMPAWKPGSQNGKKVRVTYQLPVSYELGEANTQKVPKNFTVQMNADTTFIYSCDTIEASYKGGLHTLKDTLFHLIQYPETAIKNKKEGIVEIAFTIDTTGNMTGIKITKSLSSECDNEVISALNKLSQWKAKTVKQIPVNTTYILTVPFKLTE